MSLQVWLPLNGNLNQHGLSKPDVSTVTDVSYTSVAGKTSSNCAYLNANNAIIVNYNPKSESALSFGFWFKYNSTETWRDLISWGDSNTLERISYGIDNKFYYYRKNYGMIESGNIFTLSSLNTWNHIFCTFDNSTYKIYLNGSLIKSGTQQYSIYNAFKNSVGFYLGSRVDNTNRSKTAYNDFRIYNHCLSANEVKEISMGLVAHYRLSGNPSCFENLFNNTSDFSNTDWWSTDPTNSLSVAEVAGQKCLKITRGTGSGKERDITQKFSYSYTQNDEISFTITADVYISKSSNLWCCFCINKSGWQAFTNMYSIYYINGIRTESPWVKANKWTTIKWIYKIKNTATSGSEIIFYIGDWNESEYCCFKNIKISKNEHENDYYTPNPNETKYTKLGYDDNLEPDCSGYNNVAAKTYKGKSGPTYSDGSPSPMYDSCTYFDSSTGGGSYLNCGTKLQLTDAITYSIWGYSSDWSNTTSMDRTFLSCTETGGYNLWISKDTLTLRSEIRRNGSYSDSYKTYAISKLTSGWHLFTVTYNGYTHKIYVDGVPVYTSSTTSTHYPIQYTCTYVPILIGAEPGNTGTTYKIDGDYFLGCLSDCRIYATALSQEDILALYNERNTYNKNKIYIIK